jgi:hypothetical protein
MDEDKLSESLGMHYDAVSEILNKLESAGHKVLFLDGIMLAFDAMHVIANPVLAGPAMRLAFIHGVKSSAMKICAQIGQNYRALLGDYLMNRIGLESCLNPPEYLIKEFDSELYIALADIASLGEKGIFLAGTIFALDSLLEHAFSGELEPLERENFISSAKSNAFSIACREDDGSVNRLFQDCYPNGRTGEISSFAYALSHHRTEGIQIMPGQAHHLMNMSLISFEELSEIFRNHYGSDE